MTTSSDGAIRDGLSDETPSLIEPPCGTGAESVYLQATALPIAWALVSQLADCSVGLVLATCRTSEKVTEAWFTVAVTITLWPDTKLVAVTAKLALLDPAGTRSAEGTGNDELLLESPTCTPPGPAGAASVTVQVATALGATTPGLQAIAFEPDALRLNEAD